MAFVRALSPTYFAPAEHSVLNADGVLNKQLFDIQCKRMKKSEIDALDDDIKKWVEQERAGEIPAGHKDRNVFRRASDFDLTAIRVTSGFGVRYKSPIGPIRVDIGFKLDRRERLGTELEPRYVVHFSIGHTF